MNCFHKAVCKYYIYFILYSKIVKYIRAQCQAEPKFIKHRQKKLNKRSVELWNALVFYFVDISARGVMSSKYLQKLQHLMGQTILQ